QRVARGPQRLVVGALPRRVARGPQGWLLVLFPSALRGVPRSHNRCCLRGRVHAFAWGPHPRWSHGRPQARAGLVHWLCCDERLLVLFPSALRGVPIGWRLLVLFPSALRGVPIGWRLLVLL